MALSPDEANKLNTEELAKVTNIELKIDAYLSDNYEGGERIGLTLFTLSISDKIARELERRYLEAGWSHFKVGESTRNGLEIILLRKIKVEPPSSSDHLLNYSLEMLEAMTEDFNTATGVTERGCL
jgi:hypothetical protein